MSTQAKNKTEIILAATADPANSDSFQVELGEPVTVHMFAALGLQPGEYATFQMSIDNGATEAGWSDSKVDGALVRMDSNNNAFTLPGPGTFRLVKDATTNPVQIITER